jgi:hypothetical protein
MAHGLKLLAAIGLVSAAFAFSSIAAARDGAPLPGECADTGVACRVVEGTNAGKRGTLDCDGDCVGSWGATECKNADGSDNGKCKSVKAAAKEPIVKTPGATQMQQ